MRITVSDILGWLASGMTVNQILNDFDELREDDIYAVLSYATDRENKIYQIAIWNFSLIRIYPIGFYQGNLISSKNRHPLKMSI